MNSPDINGAHAPTIRLLAVAIAAMASLALLIGPAKALAGSGGVGIDPPAGSDSNCRGKARLLNSGKAVAPACAPRRVQRAIKAANKISKTKYVWGGGHGSFNSKGYDCSGAVSFVLHGAGMLDYALDSRGFMRWGSKGRGKWVSIFAAKDHVFMTVAGLRFDTSYITDGDRSGPGWSEYQRPARGFRVRNPG